MPHQHLRIAREEPSNERKPRKPQPKHAPADPRGLGARLKQSLERALDTDTATRGYDDRRLIKLKVEAGFRPDDLAKIPGIEVVSQEGKSIVLAFADAKALETFEQRLTRLVRDGTTTRKEIFFALQAFENWTPADRTGQALAQFDAPDAGMFVVDVELWPLAKPAERQALRAGFEGDLRQQHIEYLDFLDKPSLLMYRVRTGKRGLGRLLSHRDVRLVDLPPRYGLETELLVLDINELPPVTAPGINAAVVGVLDTGLASAHPILGAAVGETAGFIPPDRNGNDDNGHGTRVAGLSLYGDVRACLQQKRFVPELKLLSGRVFGNGGTDATRFVEKNVEDAVRYFHGEYDCRVFCLSYGDTNKVYDGRHVRGLAYTLDSLSRELGVLFVVPTGNLRAEELPDDPHTHYPEYLLDELARVLDPGTALNALTVGGLSIFDADVNAQRYPNHLEGAPIARVGQPSPFTRTGPSVNQAIKPDLVANAGNWVVRRAGGLEHRRLGVLSSSKEFASGRPFNEDVGTSYAAPQIAHAAARLLNHLPAASANLLRAMLAAHARWPEPAVELCKGAKGKPDVATLTRLIGYGQIRADALFESLDNAVTLYAEDALPNDHHHFYEMPLPDDLWTPGGRERLISVALAHNPDVRTTRIDYRATQMSFRLVHAASLAEVGSWYRKVRADEAEEIQEYTNGRAITAQMRGRGTLQCAAWRFPTSRRADFKLFLVVTRHDANWSDVKATAEPYALAITIQDRENATGQLYAQIRQRLQLREQIRLRVRAGR
ncbi:MAG: S8 family peptidase [Rhodanobacteraceae bacterium]|nr:MAG: S8 family peptidase [Rhodanobacteraceae bacterium]